MVLEGELGKFNIRIHHLTGLMNADFSFLSVHFLFFKSLCHFYDM